MKTEETVTAEVCCSQLQRVHEFLLKCRRAAKSMEGPTAPRQCQTTCDEEDPNEDDEVGLESSASPAIFLVDTQVCLEL
jgi:hypothetical protein